MAADVKMYEMIAELNLSLATADSLTNILIGSLQISIGIINIIMALLCTHVVSLIQFLLPGYCLEV